MYQCDDYWDNTKGWVEGLQRKEWIEQLCRQVNDRHEKRIEFEKRKGGHEVIYLDDDYRIVPPEKA